MSAEDALAKLERDILATGSAAAWLARVDELRILLATGSPRVREIVAALGAPVIERAAVAAGARAFRLGAEDALALIDEGQPPKLGTASRAALAPAIGLDKAGREAVAAAKALLTTGADPATYTAPLFGQANRIRGSVSDVVNRAGNEGTTRVADLAELPTVWIAEFNACVHCLAYAGQIAPVGGTFKGGLTFGAKSYYPDAIATPPRHPRCRCTVEPLLDKSYAEALQREAVRSVLRGFSLESESMKVRLDAAERLLARGVNAPKSVQAFARRAIREGRFPNRG